MIKSICYIIAMSIILGLASLEGKQNEKLIRNTPGSYILKIPKTLNYTYRTMFVLGIILFAVFSFLEYQGNPSVTDGHIYFALTFAGIGFLVDAWASCWRTIVKDGTLDIQHMFFVRKKIRFSDIGKVTVGSKGELYLYDLAGKRIIKVGGLVENFGLLEDDLGRFGKIGVGKTCKDQK